MVSDIYHEFPSMGVSYMNNASVSRLPLSSIQAMNDFLLQYNDVGPDSQAAAKMIEDLSSKVRRKIASILHCQINEIIFTQSATNGINIVSSGMKFGPRSNLVIREVIYEHHANSLPWLHLQDRVDIRIIPTDNNGLFSIKDMENRLDENTALVSLSHVLYNTGAVLPLEHIRKSIPKDAIFFVDAAQSVGSIGEYDFSRLECDFMAFPCSKWLCGPMGTGILYCNRKAIDAIEPTYVGGETAMVYDDTKVALKDIPNRFEAGYRNFIGLAGLDASLDVIIQWGLDAILHHNTKMSDILRDELSGIQGVTLYGPPDCRIGVVPFSVQNHDPDEVVRRMEDQGIIMAVREIGRLKVVRAAPHFYNTESEMMQAIEVVKNI